MTSSKGISLPAAVGEKRARRTCSAYASKCLANTLDSSRSLLLVDNFAHCASIAR